MKIAEGPISIPMETDSALVTARACKKPCMAEPNERGNQAVGAVSPRAEFRNRRIFSAWGTSLISKIVTLASQGLALPIVYRSLGNQHYSSYAAVTSFTSLTIALNLGMGVALVSPVARAAAEGDNEGEAKTFSAVLLPLCCISTFAGLVMLPLVAMLPLHSLLGAAATASSGSELRVSLIIALSAALVGMPLSTVGNLRQAYQELHITNGIFTVTNAAQAVALLVILFARPILPAFVAVAVLLPLLSDSVNAIWLFHKRPYLLDNLISHFSWRAARRLAGNGIAFVLATSSYFLVYRWPVYYLARTQAPAEASAFAVFIQIVMIANSFQGSFILPFWGASTDAYAAGDHSWLRRNISRLRIGTVCYGALAIAFLLFFANPFLRLWLGRSIHLGPRLAAAMGCYILLSAWEYAHFIIALSLNAMKQASLVVCLRAVLYAGITPYFARFGSEAMFAALCASVIITSAWYFPLHVDKIIKVRSAPATTAEAAC